jgi:predicted ATP-grasp superfamily ATP-dependent carboligase
MSEQAAIDAQVPVVVLNMHHSGLGIARNLGPLGVRVLGLTHVPDFDGNRSRWVEYRRSADSLVDPEELLEQLLGLARQLGARPVLFPTRDHDIVFMNRFRQAIDAAFVVPCVSPEALDAILNKDRLFETARSIGVAVPESVTLHASSERGMARKLSYPCICKPVYASQWRKPVIWDAVGRQKAVSVPTYDDFIAFYDRICRLDPLVTLQQWIPGGEEDLLIYGSYCGDDHAPLAFFTARKRLQYPPLLGTGIVVEARPIPEIETPARALLRALAFRGISEIEFKRDPRDGSLFLIEVNPRHWDQHRLGTAAGVNLSEAAYRDATGQSPRQMLQRSEPVLWIAEREFAGHAVRTLFGRAPLADLRKVLGARRTWSVFDTADLVPILALLGLVPAKRP